MKIFTIGYGGRNMGDFLALLVGAGVRTVVDVRLRPDKAHSGEWVKARSADRGIEKRLLEVGIGYTSLVELGNPFVGLDDWAERYERLIAAAGELLVDRLDGVAPPYCLLCAEKRPEDCHRTQIARFLERTRGASIEHLV
jgi:uncharacterized protein (DUF488 family)